MPLPPEILRSRLKNEIIACQRELSHHIEVSDPTLKSIPVTMSISLLRVPGPVWKEERVMTRHVHRLQIIITEDYPYEKPIVKWQTPVFHPNIMSPEDGGYVCTKLLENWDFRSNLATFIRGLEALLVNPNPDNPFGSDSCTRAAEFFRSHRYSPPSVRPSKSHPKIVGGDGDG
ncbi:MAG: hypothetical protein LUO79_04850 [Methanomassiliicoccales archaeon]|nr:hypothetical protein [Methanomassiliicoccales archaeon]